MHQVDYDRLADAFDRRYETNRYEEIENCLRAFLREGAPSAICELGCGTGHWLRVAAECPRSPLIVGLDFSYAMLDRARVLAPDAVLVRGTAVQLPLADATFDRVFCINALHHFPDKPAAIRECARVLRPGGRFLTIGLDPHTGLDSWWIYDYFPSALTVDRARYPAAAELHEQLRAAGFRDMVTVVAQHMPARRSFDVAEAMGSLDRRSTSQLMVIPDEEWEEGLARLRRDRPELRSDLRLYATTAWM